MVDREFEFDRRSQRYRVVSGIGKGKFISAEAVRNLTERYLEQLTSSVAAFTEDFLRESINILQWEAQMASVIKEGHILSWSLGRGGIAQLDQSDYGSIGQRVRSQYAYLRAFSQEIISGSLSKQQIRARAQLYMQALYANLQEAIRNSHKREGYLWEIDVRTAKESCSECIEIAARGWVEIGTNPPIGSRECLVNDRCYRKFAKEFPERSILNFRSGFLLGERLAGIAV